MGANNDEQDCRRLEGRTPLVTEVGLSSREMEGEDVTL